MLIRNATAFMGEAFHTGMDVRVHNGRVQEMGQRLSKGLYEEAVDLGGDFLLPGFVDVHIHAFRGHDAMNGQAEVRAMSRELFREGVAAFCPTTMSASAADTARAVEGIAQVMQRQEHHGAVVLGAHMEAPFLAEERCGAQLKQHFCNPDWPTFLAYCGNQPQAVRILTLAPEKPGSEAFIRAAASRMTISIGHSSATAQQTHQAADWGATHVTHTFNAQSALHHREPGIPGAALADDRLFTELICDGIHLHPDIIRLAVRAKGPHRALAVTDAMEAAGLPDGSYTLGAQPVTVQSGAARLADGTLAGSVLTMRQALHNLIHLCHIPPEHAIPMCTSTPAASINEPLAGRIIPGSPAPLTRWSPAWAWKGILY